jgi:hypothetical protein
VNGRRCQFHQRRKILKTLRGILLQCLEQDEIFSVQVHYEHRTRADAEENSEMWEITRFMIGKLSVSSTLIR